MRHVQLEAEERFRIYFAVHGSGTFPFDMLRHDSCHPTHEREVPLLGERSGLRVIHLCSLRLGRSEPTAARWKSFGWEVLAYAYDRYELDDILTKVAP